LDRGGFCFGRGLVFVGEPGDDHPKRRYPGSDRCPVLGSAILALDYFTTKLDALELAFGQFLTAAVLGSVVSLIAESGPLVSDPSAWGPLLYSGVVAVGIGFTLQVFGQSKVDPALASLILSLEAVFALLGGMIFLGERLSGREWLGCAVMLAAVILVQLKGQQHKSEAKSQ